MLCFRLQLSVPSNGPSEDVLHCPVRLAARTILSHLVNHLFHFPMGIGAASLSSMVSEQDDNPNVNNSGKSDELTMEAFKADNVQFFILNDTTLLSFVELPALEAPMGGAVAGIKTSKSQVRVILR